MISGQMRRHSGNVVGFGDGFKLGEIIGRENTEPARFFLPVPRRVFLKSTSLGERRLKVLLERPVLFFGVGERIDALLARIERDASTGPGSRPG